MRSHLQDIVYGISHIVNTIREKGRLNELMLKEGDIPAYGGTGSEPREWFAILQFPVVLLLP